MTAGASRKPRGSISVAANNWTVEGVVCAELEQGIARVTLNRHAKRNAITAEMADRFCEAVDEIERREARVGVLAAAGTVFCAGVDLVEAELASDAGAVERIVARLRSSELLWIAEVQGGALGAGVAIVLSCSLVVMSDEAWLALPELSKLGRVPVGVVAMLTPAVGDRQALRLALSEESVTAAEAHALGWSTQPVPAAELGARVQAYATALSVADEDSRREAAAHWTRLHTSTAARG